MSTWRGVLLDIWSIFLPATFLAKYRVEISTSKIAWERASLGYLQYAEVRSFSVSMKAMVFRWEINVQLSWQATHRWQFSGSTVRLFWQCRRRWTTTNNIIRLQTRSIDERTCNRTYQGRVEADHMGYFGERDSVWQDYGCAGRVSFLVTRLTRLCNVR